MSRRLTFSFQGKNIKAYIAGKTGTSSPGLFLAEPTNELIAFEDEEGRCMFVFTPAGAFEKLELPKDLPLLRKLFAAAR